MKLDRELVFEINIPNIREGIFLYGKIGLSFLLLVFLIQIGRSFEWEASSILALSYLSISVMWNISSKVVAFMALIFLLLTMASLVLKNDGWSNDFAVYVFYCLTIFLFQEIVLAVREHYRR